MNGVSERERIETDVDDSVAMDVDSPLLLPGEGEEERVGTAVDLENPVDIERVLVFGRNLQTLFNQITANRPNDKLKTMLHVGAMRERDSVCVCFGRSKLLCISVSLSGLLQLACIHRASLESCRISP